MIAMENQSYLISKDQGFIELLAEIEKIYKIQITKYFNKTMF